MTLPQRTNLPHDVPLWMDPQKEVYYLTINCGKRGTNSLAHPETGKALLESVAFRQA